jgi:1-acyl-sn-glycerol-3-phosphate acyltransferase
VPFGSIGLTIFGLDLAFASPDVLPTGAPLAIAASPRHARDLAGAFRPFRARRLRRLFHRAAVCADPVAQRRRNSGRGSSPPTISSTRCSWSAARWLLPDCLATGISIPTLFAIAALCNAAVAVYIYSLVPEFMLRFIAWLLIHSVYRMQQKGLENIPQEGPAVLVCNHVSFVDPIVIAAASRRPIRFVMDYRIYRLPVINFIFRHMNTIPIAPAREDQVMMEAAFEEVARALEDGELVAIFPEGRITDSGDLNPFRPGVQRIVGRTPVSVIPMALQGLWGSFFSRKGGPAMSKPRRLLGLFSRITLNVGGAVEPAAATPEHLREIVAGLRGDWQ